MLSKEMILENRGWFGEGKEIINNAMDAHARQTSIDFLKWTAKEGWKEYDEPDRWIQPAESKKVITAKALYELYKKDNPCLI